MATPMHFPMKLYELVDAGPPAIVSWSESGSSFLVNDSEKFCSEVLPRHFRHSKMTSFQRQLNLYGFHRISKGADAGRYQHALFMRGRPDLVSQIKREPRVQQRDPSPPLGGGAAAAPPGAPLSFGGADAHPAFGISMAMADRKAAEAPAFDTENAALAMLSMTRSETLSDDGATNGAGGGLDSKASSPGSRKALSDSNIDAQMNIGAKLQQSLTRQSSLEAELTVGGLHRNAPAHTWSLATAFAPCRHMSTPPPRRSHPLVDTPPAPRQTLKAEMIGMNRTIEALARTVQMQQGSENHTALRRMQLDNYDIPTAAEDREDGVHQVKRRRSSESDVDVSALNALQLNSPQLSSDGSEDNCVYDRPGESPLDLESISSLSNHHSQRDVRARRLGVYRRICRTVATRTRPR
mmetsp:Transcript_41796/g.96687  ORF Transcript_41796/g.96687 Transcript_41796/m.96687 type:complete len:409 (-) Transcript_41796:221-1447(-)